MKASYEGHSFYQVHCFFEKGDTLGHYDPGVIQ